MVQDWQDACEVDDVMMEAVVLARSDRSAVITEWHLMQALLGADAVRRQFSNEHGLEKQLANYAEVCSEPCGDGTCKPVLPVKLQAALDQVILHHRLAGLTDDSMAERMTEALYKAGSELFRMVMNHFGYKVGGWECLDKDGAKEPDEEFFRRYKVGFMDRWFVSGRYCQAVAG